MNTHALQILHRKKKLACSTESRTALNDGERQLRSTAQMHIGATAVGNSSSRTCQQPSHTPPASSAVSGPQTWEGRKEREAGACLRASSVVCTKHDKLEPQAESSPHRDLLEEEAGRRTPPIRHRDSWPLCASTLQRLDHTPRPSANLRWLTGRSLGWIDPLRRALQCSIFSATRREHPAPGAS